MARTRATRSPEAAPANDTKTAHAPPAIVLGTRFVIAPVVFVLGKGGVGRSTVAAALASGFAERGDDVLVVQWAVTDAISPWFGLAAAGYDAQPIATRVATMNFSAEAALQQYFVEHLGMRAFYRSVVASRHVRALTRAAPGLEQLMFLGTIMWISTMARQERGWTYDRVVVDMPAMGHGASLLAIPAVTRSFGLGGLLAAECARVAALIEDPARSAALMVTVPDELAVEETFEYWPRITRDFGRPPLALVVNRSVRRLAEMPADRRQCPWLPRLAAPEDEAAREGLDRVYAHLSRRARRERSITEQLRGAAPLGALAIDDALLLDEAPEPRSVVMRAVPGLQPLWATR
jgi:hypothetical protein